VAPAVGAALTVRAIGPRSDALPAAAAKEITKVWSPTPFQAKILARVEFEVMSGGAAGPGKTDALIMGGVRDIHLPWYHATFFRREFPRLQEVIDRCHRYFRPLGAEWSEQKKRFTFPSGAHFSLNHCKDEKDRFNHLGNEYHYLAFDQAEEFTELIITFLIGRMRTAKPGQKLRLRLSSNPGGEAHMFLMKRYNIKEHPEGFKPFRDAETGLSRVFVPGRVWDNPFILQNDPGYIQRLLSISDPALRRAYLYGDWNVFAGQYFSEWSERIHVTEPHPIPDWHEVQLSLDYGYSPSPTVIEFVAYDEHGRATAYKELTLEKATARQIAHALNAVAVTPRERTALLVCDTQIWNPQAEKGGVSIAQMIEEELGNLGCGISLVQANKDRINGWGRVHEFMDPRRPDPTRPGEQVPWLKVFRHRKGSRYGCPMLIETIPAQVHDPKKPGDLKKNGTDHWVETLRYNLARREPLPLIPLDLLPRLTHDRLVHTKTRELIAHFLKRNVTELIGHNEGDELDTIGGSSESAETLTDVWS
jgi:hypothetical protein